MLYCYPHGIAQSRFFSEDRTILADNLIAQEVARERGVLKYRLRRAGIPFHPEAETDDFLKLIALFSDH